MKPARAVASFDSATGMLRALSRYLAGRDAPMLGQLPGALEPVMSTLLGSVNRFPTRMAETVYAASGIAEALPASSLGEVDAAELGEWVTGHYPKREYPVIFLGSSNGALVHLAAALGAPWLPQTLLLPVRRHGVDRDDPAGELSAGVEPGRALLEANPELSLHHMHDPNQDRLMIGGMSYFRVKWRRLPAAYRRFLRESLAPGGVVVSVECQAQWPVTQVDDRHYFQFGAIGGATEEEYRQSGPRVAAFLSRYGSAHRSWNPPEPDLRCPEAEWGFDTAWLDDLAEAVPHRGCGWQRLRFENPERLSPAIADVYRDWYRKREIPDQRLLLECFLLVEPWWTLRTGSVPFWLTFNTRSSLECAQAYLDEAGIYDEIRLMLFSHGTESIGLASIHEWEKLTERARKVGSTVGVDREAFPRDFATFARAHRDIARVRHVYPMPHVMEWGQVAQILRGRTEVQLEECP